MRDAAGGGLALGALQVTKSFAVSGVEVGVGMMSTILTARTREGRVMRAGVDDDGDPLRWFTDVDVGVMSPDAHK